MKTRTTIRTTAAAIALVAGCGIGTSAYAAPLAAAAPPTAVVAGAERPSLGTLTLSELKARVTEAIDRQAARITALSERVAASERLSAETKARIAERLAERRAALATLRDTVRAQTTKEGVKKVVTQARRDGVLGRGTRWGDHDGRDDRDDRDGARGDHRDGRHRDGGRTDHRDGDHRDGEHRDGGHRDRGGDRHGRH